MEFTQSHNLAHSLLSLEKYFYIHQKSEVLTTVQDALKTLDSDFSVTKENQDSTLTSCKRSIGKHRQKFNAWSESVSSVYFVNQSGEMTRDNDENDSSQLILILKSGSVFVEPKVASNPMVDTWNYLKFLREFQSLSNIFGFFPDELSLSKIVRESIQAIITASSKRFNTVHLKCKTLLGRKLKFKLGIGKDTEGYIPFLTWARGSLNSQFVTVLFR